MKLKWGLAVVLVFLSLGCDMEKRKRTRRVAAQYNIIADCPGTGRSLYTAEAFYTLEKRADLANGEVVIFPTTCQLTITEVGSIKR